MSKLTLLFTFLTAATTIAANVLLRLGLAKAGGLGISTRGLIADLTSLALEPVFMIGVVLYGAAALLWFHVLSSSSLSVAYVLLISIAFVGMNALDAVLFGASMGPLKVAGIVVILCGILMVAYSSAH